VCVDPQTVNPFKGHILDALGNATSGELEPVVRNLLQAIASLGDGDSGDNEIILPGLAQSLLQHLERDNEEDILDFLNSFPVSDEVIDGGQSGERGDLGYFFKRSPGMEYLETGSIVALCNDQLTEPKDHRQSPESALYLVVSDEYVLIKAGRKPQAGEEGSESSGHYVAWIGQVTIIIELLSSTFSPHFHFFLTSSGANQGQWNCQGR